MLRRLSWVGWTGAAIIPALLACSTQPATSPYSVAAANARHDVGVFITADDDGVPRMYLYASQHESLGLCVLAQEELCTPDHGSFRTATVHGDAPDRFRPPAGTRVLVFPKDDPVPLRRDRAYVITTVDGEQTLRRVTLVPRDAQPLERGRAIIHAATMRDELYHFAADSFKGRLSGTPENERAADWLIEQLERLNIPPAGDDYRQTFTMQRGLPGQRTSNVVGYIEGASDETIVIGAHLDHTGTLQRGFTCRPGVGPSNDICNGADDNGSGTIAVLNVAKALAAVRDELQRSVVVMWFSGEEEGLLGARHYVNNPLKPLDKTVFMVNMDMVGYLSSQGRLGALGVERLPAAAAIIREIDEQAPDFAIQTSERAGGGSDHVPFMQRRIPGVFFHTGVASNANYHRTSDTADKIDYAGMSFAARVAFETVFRLANDTSLGLYGLASDEPLITPEEAAQTCHHLMQNPFNQQMRLP